MSMTTNRMMSEPRVSGGSHVDRSCESSSRTFDNLDIHLLKTFMMSNRINVSSDSIIGSMTTNSVPNTGTIYDTKVEPPFESSTARRSTPAGIETRSKPINLSINPRVMSHVNMKTIRSRACKTSASCPRVCMMMGQAARYNAGVHLTIKLNGLKMRGNKNRSIPVLCCDVYGSSGYGEGIFSIIRFS